MPNQTMAQSAKENVVSSPAVMPPALVRANNARWTLDKESDSDDRSGSPERAHGTAGASATDDLQAQTKNQRRSRPRNQHRRRPRKKSVTFADHAQARVIPNIGDYTDAEKRRMWQTSEDKKADQADLVRTVRAARTCGGNRSNLRHTWSHRAYASCSNTCGPGKNETYADKEEEDPLCFRGLEHHVCSFASRRLKVRLREQLNDAIFDEQEAQWQAGNYHADDELLRSISLQFTSSDSDRATMLAAKDEAEVKAMLRVEAAVTT